MELVQNQSPQREMISIEKEFVLMLKARVGDLYLRLEEVEAEKRFYLDKIQRLESEKSQNTATG
jgi:hypothetical protein